MPITDDHMHLDPGGLGARAVRDFVRAGGTHLFLVNKPYREVEIRSAEDLRREYEITLSLAEDARREGAVVNVLLGPHPVHYVHLLQKTTPERAMEIMMRGMEIAGEYVGDRAVGLGEIGLPHFPVEREVMDASKRILMHGLEIAADLDAPVVIHCQISPDVYTMLASMADRAGLRRERIVRHYSPPDAHMADAEGIFISILGKRENVLRAMDRGRNFMMETDYIDDPERPGAVLGLKTIPRVTRKMLESGEMTERWAERIHVENPGRAYGVEIEV